MDLGELDGLLRSGVLAIEGGDVRCVSALPGLTNRSFRIDCANGEAFVLRLARKSGPALADRQRELCNARVASELEIGAEIVFADADKGVLLTRLVAEGVTLDQRLASARMGDALEVGRTLARLHASAGDFVGELDPLALLDDVQAGVRQHQRARLRTLIKAERKTLVPSHCDLVPGNILISGGVGGAISSPRRVVLIDWEYSANTAPAWDLAYCALEADYAVPEEAALLRGYRDAGGVVPGAEGLLGFKVLCDLVSASWALRQQQAGNPATDFARYAAEREARAGRHMAKLGLSV